MPAPNSCLPPPQSTCSGGGRAWAATRHQRP